MSNQVADKTEDQTDFDLVSWDEDLVSCDEGLVSCDEPPVHSGFPDDDVHQEESQHCPYCRTTFTVRVARADGVVHSYTFKCPVCNGEFDG